MSPKYLILISVFAVLLFAACSDDDPTGPRVDPDILLTLHLNEYFLDAFSTEGLAFASDQDGNLLATATWSGATTLVLKNSMVHPDTISFTLVQSNDWEYSLATEVGVPAGSSRSFAGHRPTTETGSAEVTFLNAPPSMGWRVSTNQSSTSSSGSLPARRTLYIYGDSTDCFTRVNPEDSQPIGGWLRGLKAGDTDTLDFDDPGSVAPLDWFRVQIPTEGSRISCDFHGSVMSGGSESLIPFEFMDYTAPWLDFVTFYAPPFDPANFRSRFYLQIDGNPSIFYQQESQGPLPDAFTKMAGELEVVSTSPDSLIFTTTAQWERFASYWAQQHELYASWYVEGPAPVQSYALPELPEDLTSQFPEFPREGFGLRFVEIYQDESGKMTRSQGNWFHDAGAAESDRRDLMEPRGLLGNFPHNIQRRTK